MIIRGEWGQYWRILHKNRDRFTRKEYYKTLWVLIRMIPLCAVYWILFTLAEGADSIGGWLSDKLSVAGCYVHDKAFGRNSDGK